MTWRTKEEGKHSTGMMTVLRARGERQGMRLAAPEGGWACVCVRAHAHTHTHTHGWRAAPLSGAQREPNLEPRDPAPPPPASQPATSQKSTMHGNQAKDSFPNGAHLLQTPLQLRTRSALRAPACRNTPRLSARGCHRFLLLFPPTCSPHPD